ncbi:MAG: TonB-dependent receptor [Bacteroidales bacterium]|jgi:TonB-linked SusC/RagA family outer membrane protein|nr:TonB-dependent receptor [Bacteroidales bacterium]MCI2145178.1 TonB-dependent receptor [Bacteroidales bacterium]
MKLFKYIAKALFTMLVAVLPLTHVYAQGKTVTGTITDKSGSVVGVAVFVEGEHVGSTSDINGKYSISDVPPDGSLVFTCIGYLSQTIKVNGRTVIDVKLEEDLQQLEEVLVVGYGVQRKTDLTGSVASVKAGDILNTTPTGNVSDALQGRIAGVSVVSGSGNPASDNTIRVRGINSITAETGPLVVIDGFIGGSLKTLNPSDIQSIEVLKDASATAVYGSRGANGVILVTTKTPKKGVVNVSFNGFANFKTVAKYPETLSAYDYALLANDYGKEYYGSGDYYFYNESQLEDFKSGKAGYDYVKAIFRDPALVQNYELSVSGGSDKTTFMASLRYEANQGVINESDDKLYNWRLKVDTKVKKWLDVGLNIYGNHSNYNNPRISTYDGLIQQAIYFPPTIEPKDGNGNYNNFFIDGTATYNPMGMIWESNNQNKSLSNRIQGYADFKIFDGLTFRSQMGVAFANYLSTNAEDENGYYYFKNGVTAASASSTWSYSWLNTNTLSYIKEFNKNNRINATAVFEQSYADTYSHSSVASDVDYVDILGANALGWSNSTLSSVSSSRTINTMMSGMLRVNYVFMNRYMATASIRADGSSRLNDKWSYFPSAAVAWNIKEEDFLKKVNVISQMKLRVGYGSVGNQAVEAYRIYSKMSPTKNADGTTSYIVDRPRANYLQWERNDQLNIGIDFGMFGNRLVVTADWYDKYSRDILLELAQPSHMGFSSLLSNSGEIRNTGVEFTISADPVDNKNFRWHTDITLTHNKGIYSSIPTPTHRQQQAGSNANNLFYMIEGDKLGTMWGYYCDGVWQQDEVDAAFVDADGNTNGKTNGQTYKVKAGNTKLRDVNKDGKYNISDQGVIGCGQPTFNWGWNNSFYFKNFDVSFFVVGFHGFDIYNVTRQMGYYNTVQGQNMSVIPNNPELENRWTATNTDTDVPGFINGGTENKVFTSRFIEDGGFVKIKNITIGYSLPQDICSSAGIKNLRIYGSLQNPFVFTRYSGMDPEATLGSPLIEGVDWAEYPNSRNFIIGVNFTF